MGKKKAAAPAAAATNPSHVYKASPLLAKPGKRSRQDALPSALHMGVCVALSLLVFAIINICVSEHLGHRNPFTRLVQSGTMVRRPEDRPCYADHTLPSTVPCMAAAIGRTRSRQYDGLAVGCVCWMIDR